MGFPLFYRNPVVTTAQTRLETALVNSPIKCGGIQVRPGDLVFGDYDGVVVVPKAYIKEAHSVCLEYLEEEEKVRSAIRSGVKLSELKRRVL